MKFEVLVGGVRFTTEEDEARYLERVEWIFPQWPDHETSFEVCVSGDWGRERAIYTLDPSTASVLAERGRVDWYAGTLHLRDLRDQDCLRDILLRCLPSLMVDCVPAWGERLAELWTDAEAQAWQENEDRYATAA
mgnify:CR=1 FL=1